MDALADIGSAASEMADSLPPPPIITYPEFMLHQRRESRPLTAATLLRAGYSLGALSAGLFIFSKVGPYTSISR